uniref:Secreted protein n=1 Tax=Steinernema glaseri TaxID=37863 RepID=A0A1I7ZMA2_9BILA
MRLAVLLAFVSVALLTQAAPTPPKDGSPVLESALSMLTKALSNVQLTEEQVKKLSTSNPEREEKLLRNGILYCDTLKKDCEASPEKSDCELQTQKCFQGIKVCTALESLCVDILFGKHDAVCTDQRDSCFQMVKKNIQ